jgi:glycosyltransferase involved in cell wall biosynthesis
VWDQSGVACILAKYQKKLGHDAKVIRRGNYDPYGIYQFYNDFVEFVDEKNFLEFCLRQTKDADIVHIHSRTDVLLYLKKKLENRIKIIMHFHGSDLRGIKRNYSNQRFTSIPKLLFKNYNSNRIRERNNLLAELYADKIFLSTPDLQDKIKKATPIIIPNPVDTDHFCKSTLNLNDVKNDIFTFSTEATSNTKWIIDYCKDNGIENLQIIDRTKNPISYEKMPGFLKRFNTYVDIRYVNDNLLKNFSKTALESLACGLNVIDYALRSWNSLPSIHEPTNVAKMVLQIYEDIS